MAKEKSPRFGFYPKDFLSDAAVLQMSLEAKGAYISLICLCWLDKSLPLDPVALAKMLHVSERKFDRLWKEIGSRFHTKNNKLVHNRLDLERRKQAKYRKWQSLKGKAGARKRHSRGLAAVKPGVRQPDVSLSVPCLLSTPNGVQVPREQVPVPGAPKAAPAPAREFLTWFQSEYQTRRHGARYFVSWEKHMPIVNRLLKLHDPPRLRKHAQMLLTTDDDWTTDTDRGIEVLASRINWLEDKLRTWEAKHHRETES